MHNTNPKFNMVHEAASRRSRLIVPESATSQQDVALRCPNHQKKKRHQNPPHNPKGG